MMSKKVKRLGWFFYLQDTFFKSPKPLRKFFYLLTFCQLVSVALKMQYIEVGIDCTCDLILTSFSKFSHQKRHMHIALAKGLYYNISYSLKDEIKYLKDLFCIKNCTLNFYFNKGLGNLYQNLHDLDGFESSYFENLNT